MKMFVGKKKISLSQRLRKLHGILPQYFQRSCSLNVVKISLKGGLGNQLFQFCAGLNYALMTNSLILFSSPLSERGFSLDFIGVKPNLVYSVRCINNTIEFKKENHGKFCYFHLYIEDHFVFEKIPKLHSHMNFDGYFQNKRYFEENSEAIKKLLSDALNQFPTVRLSDDSLYIQVRLGDMARNSQYRKVHGLISDEYLNLAKEMFPDHKNLPKVLSDDFESIEKELPLFFKTSFDKIRNETALSDFILLFRSKHLIISNSTFGWWAAFLGNARVVAPKIWYSDVNLQDNATRHLLSENWIYM